MGKSAGISASASAKTSAGKYVTSAKGFTYESSNTVVATVDENGTVTGVAQGGVEITVKHAEFGAESKKAVAVVDKVTLDLNTQTGIRVYGRARSQNGNLLLVNAASGFETVFDGAELRAAVSADNAEKFYVMCDGKTTYVDVENGESTVTLASGLKDGLHTLRVYKTTGETSEITVKSLSIASGAAFYALPSRADVKISVYGDGAVIGDGLDGVTKGYAFSAAEKLGAEIEIMSATNMSVVGMKDAWNKYSVNGTTEFVGAGVGADIVVIDLGGNDARDINKNEYDGGTDKFVSDYKAMIKAMLAVNPDAKIICCYGMTPFSKAMSGAIDRIVKTLNVEGERNVYALRLSLADEKQTDAGQTPDAVCHGKNAELLYKAIAGLLDSGKMPSVDYDAAKPDIHVIMMGGQSNMEGNSHFRYLIDADARFEEYKSGYNGIKMSFGSHEDDANNAPDFQATRLGFSHAHNNGDWWYTNSELSDKAAAHGYTAAIIDDTFGPEIGVARTLHDNGYDDKVALIKFAIGGTYFHPRYDGDDRLWAAPSGKLYKAYVTYVKACLAELDKHYNVYLDAMFWMQGESDTQSVTAVNSYGGNLNNFVKHLRNEFAEYNSDFVFYDAYINWEWEFDRPNKLNAAKEDLAANNIHHKIISSKGLQYNEQPIGKVDQAHYDAADEIKLGQLFAEAYMFDHPLI